MFEDGYLRVMVADRLAEAERLGDRARLLGSAGGRARLRSRLARFLVAVGVWLRSRRAGGPPAVQPAGGLALTFLTIRR